MEWIYTTKQFPSLSMETSGGKMSTTKVVLLDNGTTMKANYFKIGNNYYGWNIPNIENKVIAWKDIVKNDTE